MERIYGKIRMASKIPTHDQHNLKCTNSQTTGININERRQLLTRERERERES